jgi:hypothetical protein
MIKAAADAEQSVAKYVRTMPELVYNATSWSYKQHLEGELARGTWPHYANCRLW